MASPSKFHRFLDLPLELRHAIYDQYQPKKQLVLMFFDNRRMRDTVKILRLSHANRQIRKEALQYFFKTREFHMLVLSWVNLTSLLKIIETPIRAELKKISFGKVYNKFLEKRFNRETYNEFVSLANQYCNIEHVRLEFSAVHSDGPDSCTAVKYLKGFRNLKSFEISWVKKGKWEREPDGNWHYKGSAKDLENLEEFKKKMDEFVADKMSG